jgi:hypothetical protein
MTTLQKVLSLIGNDLESALTHVLENNVPKTAEGVIEGLLHWLLDSLIHGKATIAANEEQQPASKLFRGKKA